MLNRREIEYLLEELCVGHGFCLQAAAQEALLAQTPADAETFTPALFQAEGLDPLSNRRLHRAVLAHVERAYARA
jgi:hypothetical protein